MVNIYNLIHFRYNKRQNHKSWYYMDGIEGIVKSNKRGEWHMPVNLMFMRYIKIRKRNGQILDLGLQTHITKQ